MKIQNFLLETIIIFSSFFLFLNQDFYKVVLVCKERHTTLFPFSSSFLYDSSLSFRTTKFRSESRRISPESQRSELAYFWEIYEEKWLRGKEGIVPNKIIDWS